MPSSYDRREFLGKGAKAGAAFTLLGAGGTLLDACGGSTGTATTTTLKTQQAQEVGVNTPKAGAKLGGSVAFGTEAEESGMDPTYGHFDSTGVLYARCVYDPLATVTFTGEVVPYLAESITPNASHTSFRIKVRPGVVFHDGTPCNAQALKFCMDAFQASGLVNFALTYWKKNATKIIDNLTIQIDMTDPWIPFPAWLAGYIGGQVAYMFSPTAYRKVKEAVFTAHPVGTGPFKLVEWSQGSFFKCEKNPHYWRKDKLGRQLPYLDSWTYYPIPPVDTRRASLQTGKIQMMHTDDDPTIIDIQTDKSLAILLDSELHYGEPDCDFGMINTSDKVMKDIRLRQACAYSFNQEQYCSAIGKNLIKPTQGPFPAPSPYAGDTGYPTYDLAKAKALVKSWMKDNGGKAPSITYTTTTSANPTSASLIQFMFQQAGFKCAVTTVEQSQLINDALIGSYQVFSWRQFANIDPDLNYVFWTKAAGAVNFARNYDPVIDAAMDRGRQSNDQAVRVEAYQTVAKQFAKDLPYIWAARDVWCVAASKTVQNWNNPTTPDTFDRGLSTLSGIIMPTEVWVDPSA